MLDITTKRDGSELYVALAGRLDVNAAEQFDEETLSHLEGVTKLVVDMENLEYLSSAGLRVFLRAYRMLQKNGGSLVVENASEPVEEVLAVTGFGDFLTAE